MTTPADIIVGGAAGAPARLPKGADGAYLRVDPATHLLLWAPVAAPTLQAVLTAGNSANGINVIDLASLIAKLNTVLILQGSGAQPALLNLIPHDPGTYGDASLGAVVQGGSAPAGETGGIASLQAGSGDNLGAVGAVVQALGGQLGARPGWVRMFLGGADGPGFQVIDFMSGSIDPSAGAGVAAAVGSMYFRTNGELWQKTGGGDADWAHALTAVPTLGAVLVAGADANGGGITNLNSITSDNANGLALQGGAGQPVGLFGGAGAAASPGGGVVIFAGTGNGGADAGATATIGPGSGAGVAGGVTLQGGLSPAGNTGAHLDLDPPDDPGTTAGTARLTGGNGVAGNDGGGVVLTAGVGDAGGGAAASLWLQGGTGGDMQGQFIANVLPAADPHVVGAFYTTAGVVHQSAG